ncbi:MAG: hypothetical protein LBU82_03290 [Treponema sp.]|jgi:hypothetical protein|nr:hypothetical protein [Treponema sp.]
MKKILFVAGFLTVFLLFIPSLQAQETTVSFGQSTNGSTGLYSIPSGHIGWEKQGRAGLDFSYRIVMNENGVAHIPAVTASLFNWVEVSTAFDFQPPVNNERNDDILLGVKVKLPTNSANNKNPAVSLGTNMQINNFISSDYYYYAFQPYVAVSFAGIFFNMKAETTAVFGKTFFSGGPKNNYDFDFGMGFDLALFPESFHDMVHWIADFANFSYSDNSWPNDLYERTGSAWQRGIMSTGARINLSSLIALKNFKLIIDVFFNDLLDDGNRSFTTGVVSGYMF